MMKISDVIGRNDRCGALITGESIGQVASQTMAALSVTEQGLDLPVFRPLIGLDKYEIVKISHKIDTYEVSIQPYDDCCTIFQPRRPATKPRLKDVLEQESYLEADQLIQEAVENATSQIIHAYA